MDEKNLIAQIQQLKHIKPNQNWVLLTKEQILGKTAALTPSFLSRIKGIIYRDSIFVWDHKPAFAPVFAFAVLLGIFGFAQHSVPGDLLFPVRKIAEQSQTTFVTNNEQSRLNLEIANNRLEDIKQIAKANSANKLAPAINEFRSSIAEAAKSLAQGSVANDPQTNQEILNQVKTLQDNEKQVKAMGVEIGESKDLNDALAQIVEREITDLQSRTLTEVQQKALTQAEASYTAGNYTQALEQLLLVTNGQ